MSGCRLDSSGLGLEQVVGSYEHSNELSGSIKCGQFVNSGATVSLSRTLLHGAS
jgi:hypothetical protein